MNLQDIARENIILKIMAGSKLYGTDTPTSDTDYSGIFIAPVEVQLGLRSVERVDVSDVVKLESGKNAPESVDCVLYELKKFVGLAIDNNPSIIEQMFVPDTSIMEINEDGRYLLSFASKFLYKGLYDRFTGYATSQRKKMAIKSNHYYLLNDVIEFLNTKSIKDKLSSVESELVKKFNLHTTDIVLDSNYIQRNIIVGDSKIPTDFTIQNAKSTLARRLKIFSNRKELISKYGYDLKFASHVIRLLQEGCDLLQYGELHLPLENRDLLIDIKTGKYSLEEINQMADALDAKATALYETTTLPPSPNYELANNVVIELNKRKLGIM